MFRLFNRIKPQDITLVQTDWMAGPQDYTHIWLATYYGEPVGKVTYNYLRETWQIVGQTYCKKESLLKEAHMVKDHYDYGQDDVSREEIKELRRGRRVLARFLNKQRYKHEI